MTESRERDQIAAHLDGVEKREKATADELKARELATQEQLQYQKENRARFDQAYATDARVVAPRIEVARQKAEALAKPSDTSIREFSAPQAESGMVEVIPDDDWVKKARESVKVPQSQPAKKKGFFSRFLGQ